MKNMKIKFLAGLFLLISAQVMAQEWPTKPIKFVVPFGPGGANDLVARAVAQGVSKELGQPVIIENKPGAGSVLGAEIVAKSAPDGYTFLAPAAGIVTNSLIKTKMPYQEGDLLPVAMMAVSPSIIVVPIDSPIKDLKGLIEASKRSKGVNFSTAGTGSTPHFVAEMLKIKSGGKFEIVPYKSGSEGMVAVISNQVDATSEASVVVIPQIKGGKLKPIASTWNKRIAALPDVATTKEQGYGDVFIGHWSGVFAPKGTSPKIIEKMNKAVNAALASNEVKERLLPQGIEPSGGTVDSFVKFINAERKRLAVIVKSSQMHED